MKVVLDTNVVVSGLLSAAGPCGRILDLALEGQITLCADPRLADEYRAVIHRPELGLPSDDVDRVLELLLNLSDPITAAPLDVALPDPEDLPFLEVAASAGVPLVTGNRRHFPSRLCGDIQILAPRELIDLIRKEL